MLLNERLDDSWVVTESKMMIDSLTGQEREVDIVLESDIGTHKIFLSVECRDHKRKADTPWVESMYGKHNSLPTSKLVLWSATGFSKPAIEKAQQLKIDTVSSGNIDNIEWAKLAKSFKGGSLKVLDSKFSFFIDVEADNGHKSRLDTQNINYQLKETNSDIQFNIISIRQFLINDPRVGQTLLEHAAEGKSDFWVLYDHPNECLVLDDNNDWYKVLRIGFGIKAYVEKSKIETKTVIYQDVVSTLAVGKFENREMEVFIEEKQETEPFVTASLIKK